MDLHGFSCGDQELLGGSAEGFGFGIGAAQGGVSENETKKGTVLSSIFAMRTPPPTKGYLFLRCREKPRPDQLESACEVAINPADAKGFLMSGPVHSRPLPLLVPELLKTSSHNPP